jgi:hypothetical protein
MEWWNVGNDMAAEGGRIDRLDGDPPSLPAMFLLLFQYSIIPLPLFILFGACSICGGCVSEKSFYALLVPWQDDSLGCDTACRALCG